MKSAFLDRLNSPERPVLVFDGAMGTNLQVQELTAADFGGAEYEGCNEYLVHTKPEAVATVHRAFYQAGADVVETDTFGGTPLVLAEYDLADQSYYLNKAAAELAKSVAAEFSTPEKPRFVAGSMGPGTKLPTLGHVDYDTLKEAYVTQVQGLYDGGVDLLLVETCQDVLQIKAALNAIEQVFAEKGDRLPLMVSVTMETMGTMLVGTEMAAALAILERYPIDILGLNCATGPEQMKEHIKYLSEHSPFVVSCIPNAGLPENVGGQAFYRLTPVELQMALMHFIEDLGVQIIGGCCGTRPDHIKALADIAKTLTPKERHPQLEPSAASIYSTQSYTQENSFLIVGERLNASGSKKCRDLLNAEDWDSLVSLAKAQVKEGAQILDVNVDYVGRDGVRDMKELASRLVNNVTLPLMLDSTEWQKMEAGLKVAGGKCILNSTNYEDGEERFYKLLEIAKEYGAGIVIGTIDEEGMGRTADKKFEIAKRAYNAAIVSDNKILPLAKIDPDHQKICRDLIFDRREFDGDVCTYDPLGKLTTLFEGKTTKRDKSGDADLPVEERLKRHIIDGERLGLEDALNEALKLYPPLDIINIYLLDGMKVVGELFGSGQMQLPFVLQSAQTMKAAVAFLEPHMDKDDSVDNAKGTFLIATVKGDVHDIGKNLVDIILSNNGYRVVNLGIKQPVENIIQAYKEHNPDCIAMSGLLVKSTAFMKENLEVFNQEGITVPVILGGAALTPKFVHQDCQQTYNGQVIYGKDAFADLHFMDKLMPAKQSDHWDNLQGFLGEYAEESAKAIADDGAKTNFGIEEEKLIDAGGQSAEADIIDTRRSEAVEDNIARPTPPFWGTKILSAQDIPLAEIFPYLDLQALFVGQWQFRKPKDQSREEYDQFLAAKVQPILSDWKAKVIAENLLNPTVVYGYFPCQSEGNTLFIYEPELVSQNNGQIPAGAEPIAQFEFPRQKANRRLCIADFFASKESGVTDVFPMQAVTVGEIATEYAQKLFAGD
ncbi:MAG: homocysteine S-methyltransferase family protein, partial [Synechocystis sp.]